MKANKKFVTVQNPMVSYRLSHAADFASALLLFALGMPVVMIYGWAGLHRQRLDPEDLFAIGMLSCIPFAYGIFFICRSCRIMKIMKHGTRVEGQIVSYYRFHFLSRQYSKPRHIMLNVRFRHHGEYCVKVHVGFTPPNKALASERCSVYIYGNRVFVTDFIRRRKGEPETAIPEVPREY